MDRRRVVITGMGTVNPLGHSVPDSWKAVRDGVCGIGAITRYDTTGRKVTLAAEVKNFDPEEWMEKKDAKRMGRYTQFAMAAAVEAMADAGLGEPREGEDRTRWGCAVSSGIGGLDLTQEETLKGEEKGYDRVSPFYIPMIISNMAAGLVAIRFGLKGMSACPVTACAGGSNAIGDAFRAVRDGYADVMVCGGTEAAITPLAIGGFTSMKALHTGTDPLRASIPFDAERSGFVMGEGAAVLVLESLEQAQARGARIYAEVAGYGATCDAYHMTAPAPEGEGGARAMAEALADGGAAPEQVGYINAHGTSTALNDAGETAAIKAVFGAHARTLAVSSTKSMTGHLLGAAGAAAAVFTALALKEGFLPATVNYRVPDPACDLDYIPNAGREEQVEYALTDAFGFGGHNACLLLRRWEGK
ncbi:beta-ketoacyl-ACP synthase II [Candidatus Pseudoscillospira sp. SGI.172]|uniref:beta-ketoacyl-ACP synthase II n=1 Tax=Candidatus Pseudoscillospira sp. SGI.172 TaxID=3420582 RepID=UPI00117A4070|nr:beta-ketoacyl-ACP synthase II [Pseudoflavonifractor sp.]